MSTKTAMNAATVEAFLISLTGRLTQYDQRISRRERSPNIYRLSHWLKASQDVEAKMRSYMKRDDPEAMGALRKALNKAFIVSDMPPVKAVLKMMDAWENQGKLPKYASSTERVVLRWAAKVTV